MRKESVYLVAGLFWLLGVTSFSSPSAARMVAPLLPNFETLLADRTGEPIRFTASEGAGAGFDVEESSGGRREDEMRRALAIRIILGLTVVATAIIAAATLSRVNRRRSRRRNLFADPDAPRELPFNPFDGAGDNQRLFRQIENAAEASREFDRAFGVICFEIGGNQGDEDDTTFERLVRDLMATMRAALRGSDHVVFLDERSIIICAALLRGFSELQGIAERQRSIGAANARFGEAFLREPGFALYPVDGYRGEELVARARQDQRTRAARGAAKMAA